MAVRLSNDVGLVDILNVDDRWQADPELVNEFRNVPEMDYSRVIASADLLKLIVENCLKKQLNFVVIKDNPQQSEPVRANRSTNPHDSKMKKHCAILMRIYQTNCVWRMSPLMFTLALTISANCSKISWYRF